ncbi:MAG: MHS family MFS transporter [Lentisphaerae bacterium]|nr:MHS family MFS transporter [Lentisphaerota bacterium]MCP4103160.1 MHS family MFS transporter [Lentisphaerota bacterium]
MIKMKEIKVIILSCIGGSLEFFDFTIYALFAPYIRQVFFPTQSAFAGLLSTFGVFALGYLVRPIGGIIFGALGDILGRRIAFSSCVFFMGLSTLGIGLMPGVVSIGMAAPLLLTAMRILQGLSMGGEIPCSTVFAAEHLFSRYRGLAIGIVFMFITLGNVSGSLLGFSLENHLSPAQMLSWGWRIPFIIGSAVSILSFFLRKKSYETSTYREMKQANKIEKHPLLTIIREKPAHLAIGFGLTMLSGATISLFLYLPSFLHAILGYKPQNSFLAATVSFLVLAVCSVIFSYVSDKIGRKVVLITGCVLSAISGYALFYMLAHNGYSSVPLFCTAIAASVGMVYGVFGVSIIELFPANVRSTGMGVSYNLGLAIIGGLTPFLFTYFIKASGNTMAPYYVFLACAAITAISGLCWKSRFSTVDYKKTQPETPAEILHGDTAAKAYNKL